MWPTRKQSRKLTYAVGWVLCIGVLGACVQPVAPTPFPTPTPFISPTPPPALLTETFPLPPLEAWLLATYNQTPSNLDLFTQLKVGPDDIVGFTFQDSNGQNCVGFVLATFTTQQIWNGDYRCVPIGAQGLAAPLVFALTNNEFYVATYGYLDPLLLPNVGGIAVQFVNGDNITQFLGGEEAFVVLRRGVDFPAQVVVTNNTNGDTLTVLPVQ